MNTIDQICTNGISFLNIDSSQHVDLITNKILNIVNRGSQNPITSLDKIHTKIDDGTYLLNELRIKILQELNSDSYCSRILFNAFQPVISELFGSDVAVQKNIGLSIQCPSDSSSLLPIHSDVCSSDCSPFELVFWIPLTSCYATKSMFYLPFSECKNVEEYINLPQLLGSKSPSDFSVKVKEKLKFIELEPPSYAVFCHSLWHGNMTNEEVDTRVSINVRVKNLFSPYRGKSLGDFFDIASISRLTNLFLKLDEAAHDS